MPIAAVFTLIDWCAVDALIEGAAVAGPSLAATRPEVAPAKARVVASLDGVAALSAAWRDLEGRCRVPAPFQTYDWASRAAEEAVSRGETLAVVVVGAEHQASVIWPLAIERRFGLRIARWLGEPLVQYGDALVHAGVERPDLDAAWREVSRLPVDLVLLRNVREDAVAADVLSKEARRIGTRETARFLRFSTVRAAGGFDAVAGKRAAKRLKAAERRLAASGKLDFAVYKGAEARVWAEAAVTLKRQWLEERGLTGSAVQDERWRERLVDLATAHGGLVSVLSLDGRLAAAEIGFHHRGHYVAYLGAFAPELRAYSPGRIQMRATIGWCGDQGFDSYDLMAPDDPYKREWASAEAGVSSFAHARTARGRLFMSVWQWRPRLKAAYYALPPRARRLVGRLAAC